MALFGSRSDGSGSQQRGRKSKRRWTPEPGAAQARSWRDAAAPRAEHGSPPPPTRVQRQSAPPRQVEQCPGVRTDLHPIDPLIHQRR
ncbi:hypothetical protein ACHL6L_04805, partial [Amycolatopsis sp. A24]